MINKVKFLLKHPLFSGSAVMIIGTNFTNVINYVYHLIMGRLLGPTLYGELAALFSLVGLLGVLAIALNLVIVKYVSASDKDNEVGSLAQWFSRKVLLFSVLIFVAVVIISPLISSFLKINNVLFIILIAMVSVFSFMSAVNKAVLQGILNFNKTVITVMLENSTKLLLGVGLILAGFAVGGAMVGLVLSAIFGFLLSRYFLSRYLKQKTTVNPHVKQIVLYTLPVLAQSVALTSLYSTDVILVKHFFTSHQAGLYAAISMLGKIIYFGASPIGLVMFPIISKRHASGVNYEKVFLTSLLATAALSIIVLLIYWLFPHLIINLLFGSQYLEASPLLVKFGIFMVLFTLSTLMVNFYLSINQTKVVVLPLLAATFQIVGILLYHNSLSTVLNVSIIVTTLLLVSLFFKRFL